MSPDLKLAVEIAEMASHCRSDAEPTEIQAKAEQLAAGHPESDARPDEIAEVLRSELIADR